MQTKIIKYHRNLIITNIEQLPHGTGAKYLEALRDDKHGVLIAKQWRNTIHTADNDNVLIKF